MSWVQCPLTTSLFFSVAIKLTNLIRNGLTLSEMTQNVIYNRSIYLLFNKNKAIPIKSPVAIAPKLTLNAANGSTATTRVIPVVPLAGADGSTNGATLFLAPCDNNGQITHFVLTTAGPSVTLLAPNKVTFLFFF